MSRQIFLKILLIATIGLAVAGCPEFGKDGKIVILEACEVTYRLFYRDGRFTLTEAEYDALRPVNQVKVTDFKRWFKSECPAQYAKTAGGKK